MSETQLMLVYVAAVLYGTGALVAFGWYVFNNISYRLALGAIGWRSSLRWQHWVVIVLETILTLIAWPYALYRLIQDERRRHLPIQQSC